jgi:hypothetical protein
MDARFYNSEDVDIERLAGDLVSAYQSQGYKAQYIGNTDQVLIQIKKGGDFEAVLGMQAVLSVTIQRTTGGILAMIGQQRWIDKAAVGAVGIAVLPLLWPLAITAGVGAIRQASLGNQALNMVDGLVRQQCPNVSGGPVPSQFVPQVQRQWEPLPPAQTPYYLPPGQVVNSQPVLPFASSGPIRCPECKTPYEPGDTFCSGCGRPLAQRKVYCPNCNSELKPGLSFCAKCGASTFQTLANAPQMGASPAPASPPVYTPPDSPTPYYVPSQSANHLPTVPAPSVSQSPTPAHTPPSAPAEPTVYYVPSQPASHDTTSSSSSASQASTQHYTPSAPQEPPATPYYVPPVTQEPPVKPQPKVTIIQSTPKQEPPPPKPRPQQTQYYIPSDQAQQPTVQTTPATPSSATQSQGQKQPLVAHPVSKPLSDPDTPWGSLTFSNDQQIQLTSERAIVGRYDHDLDGTPPEVDLGEMEGADTVSRIHATLEHIGSTYTLTDLNSMNSTRINSKRLEPDKATSINDGDTLQFGKISCTFKKEA